MFCIIYSNIVFTDQSREAVFESDLVQHGEDGEWQHSTSTTSSQSEQAEKLLQNQHQSLASEDTKKKRAQKPSHMRRNIRDMKFLTHMPDLIHLDQAYLTFEHVPALFSPKKLLREDQLEAVTKAAQQEELERRKRLEQQRKDYQASIPTVPLEFLPEEIALRTAEVAQLAPQVLNEEVICLDSTSSGSEDDSKGRLHSIKDEVIELSSGEDESLHIVDSSDSGNEGDDDNEESSGAHVNDALNQLDASGQVIININHPPNEEDIYLAPQLARAVKPHQVNTLQNWLAEFNMWLPAPEALPADYDPKEIQPRTFKVHILNDEHKTTAARAKVVTDWVTDGGVLLMGYEMYRLLSLKKSFATGRKKKSKKQTGPVIIDVDEEDRQQELLKGIEKALSRPGPDVVICDEGHRIKNCHASTSQALKNIRSRRRVVLTGYPLQNNLIEYWCMVDFVRPDFLGTRQEFSNMFERPILNGQCIDSTPQDVRLMRYRSHVLHSLLEGFVQRRGHNVLKVQLPYKEEHVILVRLSKIQRALYTEFMNRFRDAGHSGWLGLNPLKAFCVCCKIWNHPDVLYEALQKENLANEQDLDVDDLGTAGTNSRCQSQGIKVKTDSNALPSTIGEATNSKYIQGIGFSPFQERANQVVTYEWAKDILCDYQTGVLQNSPKMVLLFHLVDESVTLGDKLLVFSQSLSTLSVIEDFLAKRPVPSPPGLDAQGIHNWIRNVNYYRLDGSTSASERERLINQFNDPSNTSVCLFLLSTRAGCLGVNLIGANRVIVFDASWNPCHDAQAVCRVYRYGQKKPCHIYRLVSDYTLEKKIYDRQISKQGMSDRVVDDLNPVLNFTRREVENLLHFVEEESEPPQLPFNPSKIKESVLQLACLKYPHLITKEPFQHESLLIDRKEHKLTKAEKKAAKKSYEEEKRASVPYTRPSYAQYYPATDQNLTNIPAFNQRNWRPSLKGEDRPVASVRPVQSTPIPMMPRHVPLGSMGAASVSNPAINFPINYLQRAGVLVQKIVTTTDIVIPGTNTSTDVQARISAGESIHIIRGTKGTYIRTSDGRIFAIRTTGKPKGSEDHRMVASGSQGPSVESTSNGRHNASSPQLPNPEELTRPISPDSPEIISELQQYAEAAAARESKHNSPTTNTTPGYPARKDNAAHATARGTEQRVGTHGLASSSALPATSQPVDSHSVLDLRGNKRKSSSPSGPDEQAHRQQKKRSLPTTGQPYESGYPVSGGFTMPSVPLNHNLTHPFAPQAGNSLYMGTGSSYYQLPSLLSDPHLMFPVTTDPLLTAGTASSSAATSATASVPSFMLNPSMTGVLSNYSLPFSQSLLSEPRMFAPFPSPVLSSSLPRSMASAYPGFMSPHTGYPAGGLLRSQVPPFDTREVSEVGCSSNEDEDKDDDVIEITGK
ncbi:Helicase ARIP4, partial [Ophiophagus hannah]